MQPPDTRQLPQLIRKLLSNTACYDHPVGAVQLIETHISWVILTGEYAYKIKKNVDMGFLDFSTQERRKLACEDEVRLNSRLAPDIYLAVVGISGSPEHPHLNDASNPFEFAVKMRQFDPRSTLDRLSERLELDTVQIDAIAARVASFHSNECDVATLDSPYGDPDSILQSVMDNFRILVSSAQDPTLSDRLVNLQDWSASEHQRLTPLMHERKLQGWVRECHGDLHLGNIAWSDGQLIVFDCIEFNASLRWIDVISEVAFCFMDLLYHDHPDLAFRFLNAWLEITGDYRGISLLRYYAVYRVMVRAKVAALRACQAGEPAELDRWLLFAERLAHPDRPPLWITHGLSGSGKTTFSQSLLQEHGMVRLRSDVERKRLAGRPSPSGHSISTGLYSDEAGRRTYAYLASLADGLLDAGWPVIIDAACLRRWQRDLFRTHAQLHSSPFRILDIEADPDTLRERLVRRAARGQDASDADLSVLQHQLATSEPLDADERELTVSARDFGTLT